MTNKLVLVVEDDVFIRETFEELLLEEGFKVVCTENGQMALDYLAQANPLPAIILLDVMMPVKDGFAFRNEQLADPRVANIPVIVLSASSALTSKKISADAFVPKPFSIEDLMTAVNKFFP